MRKLTVQRNLKINVITPAKEYNLYNPGGLESLIEKLAFNVDSKLTTPVYQFDATFNTGEVVRDDEGLEHPVIIGGKIAFAWSTASNHQTLLYTNNVPNPNGGTPIRGAFAGISKLINRYAKDLNMSKSTIEQRDILPGLILVINLTHPNPKFDGQTKKEITSSDAVVALNTMVYNNSQLFFDRNIEPIKNVIKNALSRAAERKKEEEAKINVSRNDANKALSHKLEPSRKTGAGSGAELFIVEGDSAGGSVVDERDTNLQAVIPVRGKTLNTWKTSNAKAMSNTEIVAILTAIGTGVGKNFNIAKRNYDKIIITTDQDPDGSHISCLLLTTFLKYTPQLLLDGYVYRVITPLFVNTFKDKKKKPKYTYSNKEQQAFLKTKEAKSVISIKRNKGIGEVSSDLVNESIISSNTRRLLRYKIKDEYLDDAMDIVNDLMGDSSDARKSIFFNPDIYELIYE